MVQRRLCATHQHLSANEIPILKASGNMLFHKSMQSYKTALIALQMQQEQELKQKF
jgi:hypothetical protein